ncbi:MAG: adenylate/guanylate cyclase domain-containing protein, partial [Myxococcales bacterium]|nr:adenylate/guanylate cyclase domain-containing protein [Myxococcales bacterium]
SQLIGDFLVRAQQTGEVSVSIARIVLCLAFLAMHLPFRLKLMIAGDPKSWILIGGFLIGLGFSFMSLRWGRLGSVSPRRVYLSVAVDAFLVYVTIASGVIWPHEGYIGLLREHEPAIVYLAIVASGVRLSEQGAIFGAVIHALGLVGLLALDRMNAAVLRYTYLEIVFAGAFFVVAAIIAYSIAHRTRSLIMQGARAAVLVERARQRLGVYVSEAIADNALGTAELELGGATRRAAILFSDLRGFTRYAERLPPERLVEELNAYLKAMVEAIKGEGGVVDKYIGDAVMAVFGLPNERPGEAARAIRAAAAMNAALADHNRERAARGLPPLAHGIGVHYGPMVAGNIGTPERMQYTVIGDVVNLASRLESATKEEHVDVLISADAVAAAEEAAASGQTIPPLRRHGSLTVRGREQSLEVFTLA